MAEEVLKHKCSGRVAFFIRWSLHDSQIWGEVRERVLASWDGYCLRCGKGVEMPNVHHLAGFPWRWYGVVCPECHGFFHRRETVEGPTSRLRSALLKYRNRDHRFFVDISPADPFLHKFLRETGCDGVLPDSF